MGKRSPVSPQANAWLAVSALLIGLGNLGSYFSKEISVIYLVCGIGWLLIAAGYFIRLYRQKKKKGDEPREEE